MYAARERPGGGAEWVAQAAAVEAAQGAVAVAEAAALRAEAAHSAARQGLDAARTPFDQAERRLQRLDTQGKTLARLLGVDAQKLGPSAIDLLAVAKGFEAALGPALGDDLDPPHHPPASLPGARP